MSNYNAFIIYGHIVQMVTRPQRFASKLARVAMRAGSATK